jgi:hypothetical protein
MPQKIKVRALHSLEIREITLEEAEKLLRDIYRDPLGGLIADAATNQVIYRLTPEIKEIIIIEQMLGGG